MMAEITRWYNIERELKDKVHDIELKKKYLMK